MKTNNDDISDVAFVQLLRKHKRILNKSQVPAAKQKKESSISELKNDLQQNYGVAMTEGQIMKKVNNMKTRLKKKIDLKQTGNVPIILSEWQKLLNEILEGDSNPSIKRSDGELS
nr:unnamed protein product [Callosobruchus chinensis]